MYVKGKYQNCSWELPYSPMLPHPVRVRALSIWYTVIYWKHLAFFPQLLHYKHQHFTNKQMIAWLSSLDTNRWIPSPQAKHLWSWCKHWFTGSDTLCKAELFLQCFPEESDSMCWETYPMWCALRIKRIWHLEMNFLHQLLQYICIKENIHIKVQYLGSK